jgi:hypothetical protein
MPAIALALAFAGGTWIDVPFVKQPKNDCGPASLWMVMQYWNSKATPSIEEIHRAVFSKAVAGVNASDMEGYLTANGFQTSAFAGEWEDLVENVAKGRPLIVALRGSPLHYVVVAGIDANEGLILLNDPASRKLRAMHRADFESRWHVTSNWALLASPAVPAMPVASDGSLPLSGPISQPDNPDLEAASSAFRHEDYRSAKKYAQRAESADSHNATTNDLLATLYLLDDNVEAALKYWNRTEQPAIRNIEIDPRLKVDPVVLDSAFAFSRGSILTDGDFLLTKRRLDATRLLSNYTFDFSPVDDKRFDVTLRAADATGAHYLSWLQGLPYQTIRPQFTNIGGRTLNVASLFRWDSEKRRLTVSLDGPIGGDCTLRFSAAVDGRDELWYFRGNQFSLRRIDTTLSMQALVGSRGTWISGLTAGTGRFGYRASFDYDLVRLPEHRMVVSGGIRSEIGRDRSDRFAKGEPSVRIHWLPKAHGADFETSFQVRAGRASAATPVDELFILGLERDSDLLLRAHSSLNDGRKGAGPVGNRYVLLNVETAKILRDFGLARLSVGPFVDIARMSTAFVDTGFVLRLSFGSSLNLSFSLGRDLRSGHTIGFFN